jgi:sterol-4alpha-carboxylate 3-dehydrogenase (decarboxylating)
MSDIADEHILVTGGAGFVGSHIVRAFEEKYAKVSILDLKRPITQPDGPDRFYQADVTDYDQVLNVFKQVAPTVVVHAAGIVPTGNDRYSKRLEDITFKVNVEGTKNIIRAVKECKIQYLVFTGSVTCVTDDVGNNYPNYDESTPLNASLIYGQSKVRVSFHSPQMPQLTLARASPKS